MSRPHAIRKAALLISLMERRARVRLLGTLPAEMADALREAVRVIEREGWNRREVVELALEGEDGRAGHEREFGVERLLRLAGCVDSAAFSRVLAASEIRDTDFLASTLDAGYAGEVERHLQSMASMPEQLRRSIIVHANGVLEEARERG